MFANSSIFLVNYKNVSGGSKLLQSTVYVTAAAFLPAKFTCCNFVLLLEESLKIVLDSHYFCLNGQLPLGFK